MMVFLNDRLVDESQALVPVSDRSFLYGDALFETVRVHHGRLVLWTPHLARLLRGAQALGIQPPATADQILEIARTVIQTNALKHGLLRLHLSRGSGPRGYSPRGADSPTLLVTAHPSPELDVRASPSWTLVTSTIRLPEGDPLAAFKTASKLPYVYARSEAEARGAHDALLLNTRGELAETTSANLFWFDATGLCTPAPEAGALMGTTQAWVQSLAPRLGWTCRELRAPREAILAASGAFLTLSSLGVVGVSQLDGQALPHDPRLSRLREEFMNALPELLSG
ncbi:MAG: aminotransferase class IV [Verrucomicrobiales bacterium]|nr:aminotransferase class IV [Verrucomicrobiales bacterium]